MCAMKVRVENAAEPLANVNYSRIVDRKAGTIEPGRSSRDDLAGTIEPGRSSRDDRAGDVPGARIDKNRPSPRSQIFVPSMERRGGAQ
jgi:hypothetical protein